MTLNQGQWLAAVGRFKVLVINQPGLSFGVTEDKLFIQNPQIIGMDTDLHLIEKPALATVAPELDQLRYTHLWKPFVLLSKFVEYSLVMIHTYVISNWIIALVIFTILMRLLLLPVSTYSAEVQRQVDQIKMTLAPKLKYIKANFKGAEAHERIMVAHKDIGISPFYTLKPMIYMLVQIPFLIGIFNALGEMPQFKHSSFLWIENMAYPDALFALSVTFPLFGNEVNVLPFLMTIVSVVSILIQKTTLSGAALKTQRRNLYAMSFAFFLFFYSFPAVMVLFWIIANLLQAIQQWFQAPRLNMCLTADAL